MVHSHTLPNGNSTIIPEITRYTRRRSRIDPWPGDFLDDGGYDLVSGEDLEAEPYEKASTAFKSNRY